MADYKKGAKITQNDIKQGNYGGFLKRRRSPEDFVKWLYSEYLDQDWIDPNFVSCIEDQFGYKSEITYIPVYRVTWDAELKWNTTRTSYDTSIQGDWEVTTKTTTTTKHQDFKQSGATLGTKKGIVEDLKAWEFPDEDVYQLGNPDNMDLHYFSFKDGAGEFVIQPWTESQIGEGALSKAKSEDSDKSVNITWTCVTVLVPIYTIYDTTTGETIFAMNLYNETVGYDNFPLKEELAKKAKKMVSIALPFKLGLFAIVAVFNGIIAASRVKSLTGTFKANFGYIALIILNAAIALIAMIASNTDYEGVSKRIRKKQNGNFIDLQYPIFIVLAIVLIISMITGITFKG